MTLNIRYFWPVTTNAAIKRLRRRITKVLGYKFTLRPATVSELIMLFQYNPDEYKSTAEAKQLVICNPDDSTHSFQSLSYFAEKYRILKGDEFISDDTEQIEEKNRYMKQLYNYQNNISPCTIRTTK